MPSQLVMISWNDGDMPFPGNPLPSPPQYPSNSLPGAGYPDQTLPGGGHIAVLPVYPFDPTLSPDNELPTPPPPVIWPPRPGNRFVAKWLACKGLILVPDNSLPQTPEPK